MNQKLTELKHLNQKLIAFSVLLFMLVLVIGGTMFFLSMHQIIRTNKSNELTRTLDYERIRFEASVINEINLAVKMASSPVIMQYLAAPDNVEIKKIALNEIASFKTALGNNSIFWISDTDKKYYFDDRYQYTLDTANPKSGWYLQTLAQKETYTLNVQYDIGIKKTKLWVNIPVKKDGKSLGITGIGIDISAFIDNVYRNRKETSQLYFLNSLGEITGAKDAAIVEAKTKLEDKFGSMGTEIFDAAKQLSHNETKIIETKNRNTVGISKVEVCNWYIFAVSRNSIKDYNIPITLHFLAMMAIFVIILVAFNIFISKILKSLVDTMKELDAASKTKSNFLAKMSHEIRTPMNAIIGMTELALRENLPPNALKQITTVKQSANSLLSIVNDILDFSKIESGRLQIMPVNYSFPTLINDVVSIIETSLISKGIMFEKNIDPAIPDNLFGDDKRIKQILTNILTNAIKYTHNGLITLSIKGEITTKYRITLTIEVSDTGIGIRQEDIGKLFDDFLQVDPIANRNIQGTGLGLLICKNLIEEMNGEIRVKSTYGKGSTFTVILPQKITPTDSLVNLSDNLATKFVRTNEKLFSAPNARVLIVDDNEVNLAVTEGLLIPYGVKMDFSTSGKDAIEKIKNNRYDLVLMDHMMPVMDGVETTKLIREMALIDNYYGDLPIIAFTANAVSGMREKFISNGFNDFLSKPIDTVKLNEVLRKWLKKD